MAEKLKAQSKPPAAKSGMRPSLSGKVTARQEKTVRKKWMPELDALKSLLLHEWDPIGIAGTPEAADEYDRYAMRVFSMLARGSDANAVAEYLNWVVTDQMLLAADPDHDEAIAQEAVLIHEQNSRR